MNGLFLRALLAFLILPGIVAFAVPACLAAAAGRPIDPIAVRQSAVTGVSV